MDIVQALWIPERGLQEDKDRNERYKLLTIQNTFNLSSCDEIKLTTTLKSKDREALPDQIRLTIDGIGLAMNTFTEGDFRVDRTTDGIRRRNQRWCTTTWTSLGRYQFK